MDTFPDNAIHFLDILISSDNTDVYYKSTHTGQYTHFSSFEPFFRKIAWVIEITSWLVSAYGFYSRVVKDR